ncbi:MAG: CRISPR-associated endonuclease Cas4/Cas1 [Acidobacteria bacterium RIFCSPLOWO2_02_FULL_64_15]|nr:MAG: CRISPR-associated endonuclease Cas4/Cas1 [Acidobacteria bacterium RIFCSPLOWO2_02_FULL_64_15]
MRARLTRGVTLPDYLPARMLNEFVYCPRLFFYEWVENVFAHSADTVEGALRHEKLETRADAMPAADAGAERIHSRSVNLSSDTHRLIAVIDLVEGEGGTVAPVDYKRGAPRDGAEGPEAWPADRAQICAQALILRDNGYRCDEAIVYYNQTKQRVRVSIDEGLVTSTLDALTQARATGERGEIPPPLVDSPKCPRCSLVSICLPDETAAAMSLQDPESEQLLLFEDTGAEHSHPLDRADDSDVELRRLVPARDDLRPLYVTGHGLSIGKSGDVLQVRERKSLVQEVRLNEVSQVNVFGNVSLTSAAIQGLCWAEKPIAHFSTGGWFYGLTQGLALKNVFLRRDQFACAENAEFCLHVAREIVATKIRNQRTLLQRNHIEPPARALALLKQSAQAAGEVASLESLLGVEGTAARVYFEQYAGMLKAEDEDQVPTFDFAGRNRRPPRDPVNALLSLAYSLLARDLTMICHAIGFDPFIGFYHQPRFGRPALALDLMEGFRPLVADSAVLTAINGRMVAPSDFIQVGPAISLNASGRKALIRAYEQRMDTLVTHPLFGYRVSYRRVLEIQARLLARVVTGELPRYPGFETR